MESMDWISIIRENAAGFGVAILPEQEKLFAGHIEALLAWNSTTNLTAITEPEEVAVKHVLDSIVPVRRIPDSSRVLDIGSGGGFPGIPLKIMNPSLTMTLVDAVRKKANFLKYVIRTLGLPGIEAHHVRAEDMAGNPLFETGFDVITCRALASLDVFAGLALPLLRPGGVLIALKGRLEPEETEALERSSGNSLSMEVERYILPVFNAERAIVRISRL